MHRTPPRPYRLASLLASAVLGASALGACSDQLVQPVAGVAPAPATALQAFNCTATREELTCTPLQPGTGDALGVLVGGQNIFVKLTSANASYDAGTEIFSMDVTVQNLMNEAMGTPDGATPDPDGIQVFFHDGPNTTQGSGEVTVANADGTGFFTAAAQPFFRYSEILEKDEVSAGKTWQFTMPSTVLRFSFVVLIETDLQPLLVINEVLVNPANYNASPDLNGEWFEVYNAGSRSFNMQNLVIADSAASGRRPYHLISSSLDVAPGAYVVLGNSTNTTANGGVPVDYAYGAALALTNSLDALKIARVVGTDTLTIDRTQFASAAISARDGISRELTNPALDNSNMDGSNWADALVTAVYGPGGRGTPKAQNSTFTP